MRRCLLGTAREGVKQQQVFCILDTIVRKANWVYGIPKIVLEFVKILSTETNPKFNEIG